MSKKKKTPFFDKKYLSRVGLYVAVSVFAVGVLFYIGYHMANTVYDGIDIMYAKAENISKSVFADGYILRCETTIGTSSGGYLNASVADGSKVKVGDKVADVYSTFSPVTQAKISLVESQISFYERCSGMHMSVGDTSSSENEIASNVIEIRRAVDDGDLTSAIALKSSLVLNIRRLGVLTGRVTDYKTQIASLTSELSSLRASLGTPITTVYATASGYYFSTTDGYESIFSSKNIDALTFSDFSEMISAASQGGTAVQSGNGGKIVSDFKWYVACPMTSVDAANYEKGYSYTVTLGNNVKTPLEMEVYNVLSNATDSVVIFECTRIPSSFDYTRCQTATLVYDEVTGFKVPISAVRMYDGYEGVYILDEVTVDFRRITVIGEENGYFLCEVPDEESAEETAVDSETAAESESEVSTETDESTREYPYLSENDMIIKSGTGIYVGMTYDPKHG